MAVISFIATGFVWALAGMTVLTHASQILGIPFRTYAYLCAAVAIVAAIAVVVDARVRLQHLERRDFSNLALIVLVGAIGSFLAVSMHRVGRISPDEYYYAANPVYYTQHPDSSMGFEDRLFYSTSTVDSAAFFTAGAYEYAEAAWAYLANIRFATVYYIVGAGVTGFLIPLSIFLAVYCLSGSAAASTVGAFITVVAITLMGETSWAPGANAFVRAFEGKALLQFVSVPLLTAFSIRHFRKPGRSSWWTLAALAAASAGSSTTSFALLPILGIILWASYTIAFLRNELLRWRSIRGLAVYLASFGYLGVWAIFVARHDGIQTATFLNGGYPGSFAAYATTFIYAPFPLTPVLTVLGCLLAVISAQGKARSMLIWWIGLSVLIALNPWTAGFLLQYLRGIYYRLFYVLPFPISLGLAVAFLYRRLEDRNWRPRFVATAAACAAAAVLPFLIPVSVLRLPLYAWGNTLYSGDLVRAAQITQTVPPGPMLAAYPLSGAVTMLDSDIPQMLTRPDLLDFYLRRQGDPTDAFLRSRSQLFLDGDATAMDSVDELLRRYPEIRSIVLDRQVYAGVQDALDPLLTSDGFSKVKVFIPGILVFTR